MSQYKELLYIADYPRDLVGYGPTPPNAAWPNGARAVQFVLNYRKVPKIVSFMVTRRQRCFCPRLLARRRLTGGHMSMESIYEYGQGPGVWRIPDLFRQRQLPLTVFAVAMAAARHPVVIETALADGHEIAYMAIAGSIITACQSLKSAPICNRRLRH